MAQQREEEGELHQVPEPQISAAGFSPPPPPACSVREKPIAARPPSVDRLLQGAGRGSAAANPSEGRRKGIGGGGGGNRCAGCGRKVGLTGFRCRCGDLFCGEHRYSDRHACGFDYRAAGRAAIERENPVVRAAKIVRI